MEKKAEIIELVISGLKELISNQNSGFPVDDLSEITRLFGPRSFIDSLTLVSLIVDIEQKSRYPRLKPWHLSKFKLRLT